MPEFKDLTKQSKDEPVRVPHSLDSYIEVQFWNRAGAWTQIRCNNREHIAYDLRCAGYCVIDPPEPREINDRTDWNEEQSRLAAALMGRHW